MLPRLMGIKTQARGRKQRVTWQQADDAIIARISHLQLVVRTVAGFARYIIYHDNRKVMLQSGSEHNIAAAKEAAERAAFRIIH